jgi:hypothetical protein
MQINPPINQTIMKKQTSVKLSLPRNLFFVFLIFLITIACNQQTETTPSEAITPSVEGVWEMTHHFFLNQEGDTVYVYEDNVAQHKIYKDGYVMWNSDPDADSSEWHGFGTYVLKNDTIIERLLSMSLPMQAMWESGDEAILKVEYDENSFKQSMDQVWQDTVYYNIEVYKRLK